MLFACYFKQIIFVNSWVREICVFAKTELQSFIRKCLWWIRVYVYFHISVHWEAKWYEDSVFKVLHQVHHSKSNFRAFLFYNLTWLYHTWCVFSVCGPFPPTLSLLFSPGRYMHNWTRHFGDRNIWKLVVWFPLYFLINVLKCCVGGGNESLQTFINKLENSLSSWLIFFSWGNWISLKILEKTQRLILESSAMDFWTL